MKEEQIIFLELLKTALWGEPADLTKLKGINPCTWKQVLRLSSRQRTTALIADGIEKLPEFCLPPREMYLKLLLQSGEIVKANHRINQALREITVEYQSLDCPFILLKGQGLALNYPHPLHRTPGDLDLFLYQQGDYEKIKAWINLKGYPREPESLTHLGFDIDGIHIEIHRLISKIEHPKYHRLLKKKVEEILAFENPYTRKIGETEVRLLSPAFNAFFVFLHMFSHFVHFGVSIRQFCDWLLLLKASKGQIDSSSFESLLDEFVLRKAASVFANAAIKYLGVSPALFPFELYPESKYSEIVMKDILDAGHFGFYRPGKRRPKEKWRGRWFSFLFTCKRAASLFPVAPHHISILPLVKLSNRIKISFQRN